MNKNEDQLWRKLVALSSPTYIGAAAAPSGFTTRILARWHAEARQCELMERVGLKALLASVGLLLLAAGVHFGVKYIKHHHGDLEPGLRDIIQVENVQGS